MKDKKFYKIDKKELEALLGRKLSDYRCIDIFPHQFEHGTVDPLNVLMRILNGGIPLKEKDTPPRHVASGYPQSGDIFVGAYNTAYFMLGETADGKRNIFVNLGGDTPDAGTLEVVVKGAENYEPVKMISSKR